MSKPPYILPIPYREPLEAFAPFADDPVAAFLDSAAQGRYSIIAVDPFDVIEGDLDDLSAALSDYVLPPCTLPFGTGAVGHFGYELAGTLEDLPSPKGPGPNLADMLVGLYDVAAVFDVAERRAWVVSSGFPDKTQDRAEARATWLAEKIANAPPAAPVDRTSYGPWQAEQTPAAYQAKVAQVIEYIRAGDIFQANLSQRFLSPRPAGLSPFELYRRLRAVNPAPFGAYLACRDGWVLSASPERFLSLDTQGRVEARPIKGTRARGKTPEADKAQAKALLTSEKDRAENLMIVDLLRNDLSKVSKLGSVKAPVVCGLESFETVHHLVSVVEGQLAEGLGPVDLLKAAFPGGSITGAPKIRAMEVIHELEPARRGPYCGAVGWIGFDGAMDSSIVIRALVVNGDSVCAQAGGGIVSDSDPVTEYEETLTKVGPLLAALDGKIAS